MLNMLELKRSQDDFMSNQSNLESILKATFAFC